MAHLEQAGSWSRRVNEVQQNHEFMALLGELERRFPVDEWTVDSVRVWPIARIHLYYGFFEHQYFGERPVRAGIVKVADLPRLARRLGKSAWQYLQCSATDFRNTHYRNRPHDALFLNYNTYMTRLNGRWYSRICDPLVEQLSEKGLSSLMLTGGYEYATPRFTKSRFIQPHLVIHRLLGMAAKRRRQDPPAMLREIEAHAKASGLFSPSFNLVTPVEHHARQTIGIARYFKRVLSDVRPKVVFVTCWYGTESMACVLACNELGIPTIDIQHGSQDFHVAYDRWNRVPLAGFELMPTFFWCWSESEASTIRKWAGERDVHQPIVGGNPFLERWIAGDDALVRAYDASVARLKEPSRGKVQVLYTLNGSTKDEIKTIVDIIEAVNQSGMESHFWIRLHPIALDQKGLVRKTLEEHGLRNVDVENATTLPLYALLRHMDVHITEFSSVVIEAQAFGVPSVTGEQGIIWFPSQVATGWAVMARSLPEWVSGIRLQLNRRKTLTAAAPRPDVSSARALDALLDSVRGPHADLNVAAVTG
jgi:glycosyltransferase involved in cell wall biosynthesis